MAVIMRCSTEFGRFGGPITSNWLKIYLYCLRHKCRPTNLVFRDISLMAIFADVTENECNI